MPAAADLVVSNARVVHGDGRVTPRASLTIRAGRIERIAQEPAVGPGRRIDAAGRTAIAGLIDTHVHVEDWMLPLFLTYGVTTVRDLHNSPAYIFPLARDDSSDRPRIVAAGALLDGHPSFWKNAVEVTTIGEARAAVRRDIEGGARVIKAYTRINPALISVIVAEATARGVPVAAHLGITTAVEAASAGIESLEHLSGVADAATSDPDRLRAAHRDFLGGWTAFEREWPRLDRRRLEDVAKRLVAKHVTIVPTLALHEAYSRLGDEDLLHDPALGDVPDLVLRQTWDPTDIRRRARWTSEILKEFKRAMPVLQDFVRTYWKLGGRIAAGTDTAQQYVIPGASLHRELELYVAAGLSPVAALQTATRDAAGLLGLAGEIGTIDEGKAADILLLEGDPLADISATRKIWKVIKGGKVVR